MERAKPSVMLRTRKRGFAAFAIAAMLSAAVGAYAAPTIESNLHRITLKNGMTFFVYPRSGVPLFSAVITVDAGSVNEQAGRTGLAHLLEHMAFKGTPWIGTSDWEKEKSILEQIETVGAALVAEKLKTKPDDSRTSELTEELAKLQKAESEYIVSNEYDRIITGEGGQEVNATTGNDFTNYFMTLPSNKFELWAMMESERLLYPAWREFYVERDVVAEERRMRVEDSPSGCLYENFTASALEAMQYRNPVIGWMSDIQNLTVGAVSDFYYRWYVPQNMVAVVVGDLKVEEVQPIIEKYFGSMPARPSPERLITTEPVQKGEKRIKVIFDAQPQIVLGWHKPTFPDPDTYVIEVIQYLMTRAGRSSRLYERLVKRDAICQEVESFTAPGDKYPNLYVLWLTPKAPHTNAEAEKAAQEEIERLKREPVSEQELIKVRNQIDASFLQDLETNMGFARRFGYYYTTTRDSAILDKLRENMKAVTAQDVMRVAQKYFTTDNQTVAELEAAPKPSAGLEPVRTVPASASTSATKATKGPRGKK